MRVRHINFAVAIAASMALHLLLWPASKHIKVSGWNFGGSGSHADGQVTLLLNTADMPAPAPPLPKTPPPPKPPEVHSEDEMGEAKGNGTGAQAAKGADPIRAPEADQDQAFLSRDPVGAGRIGDPPTEYTGPRGEDGSGGQVGGIATPANPSHAAPSDLSKTDSEMAQNSARDADVSPRQPRQSVVHGPEAEKPSVTPPEVSPPPSGKSARGAAAPDVTKPPQDAVRQQSPLVQVASAADNPLIVAPEAGPLAEPKPAISSAPKMPGADVSKAAIVKSPTLPLPPAAVATPPPPAVDVALPKTDTPTERPQQTAVASADPNLMKTGDGRAPGRDRHSADPAQESDSESDAFSKTAVADVLHDGRLEVRKGRKIKTTRPHFLPGAEAAFLANPEPSLVMKIAIDPTGKVTSADIIRSSGSIEIDQPCRVAVYDWWIEPAHDKAGHPVRDVIEFTFFFR